jgi:hypothetical protein
VCLCVCVRGGVNSVSVRVCVSVCEGGGLKSVFGRLKASCTIFVLQHVCDTHTHTSGPV